MGGILFALTAAEMTPSISNVTAFVFRRHIHYSVEQPARAGSFDQRPGNLEDVSPVAIDGMLAADATRKNHLKLMRPDGTRQRRHSPNPAP
jgi:hypothetical protein